MDATAIYQTTIAALRRAIEQHPVGATRRPSVKAFCDQEGFNRSNLTEIFGERQEMSVGLFMRLAAALGKSPGREVPTGLDTLSLRTYLGVDSFSVQQAMYAVNFA